MSSPVQLTANANANVNLSCECECLMKVFERILLRLLNLPQGDHPNIINLTIPLRAAHPQVPLLWKKPPPPPVNGQ